MTTQTVTNGPRAGARSRRWTDARSAGTRPAIRAGSAASTACPVTGTSRARCWPPAATMTATCSSTSGATRPTPSTTGCTRSPLTRSCSDVRRPRPRARPGSVSQQSRAMWNWWPEGVRWDTSLGLNHADQVAAARQWFRASAVPVLQRADLSGHGQANEGRCRECRAGRPASRMDARPRRQPADGRAAVRVPVRRLGVRLPSAGIRAWAEQACAHLRRYSA